MDYFANILTNVAVFGIITLGLDVQWGWAGLLDLTFFTFVACGAYAYAVFAMPKAAVGSGLSYVLGLHWAIVPSVVVAVVITTVFAGLVGALALKRLKPEYLAIVTLCLGLVVFQVVTQQQGFLNGTDGLFNIPAPFYTASWLAPTAYPLVFFAICAVVLALCTLLVQRLRNSGFGRAVRAARDSDPAAQSFGYSVFNLRLKAFMVGGALAGLGGALLAAYLTAFNTGAWAPTETFLLFVAVLIGGRGRPVGVLIGVFIISGILQEVTRYLPEIPGNPGGVAALRMIVIGALMIAAVRLRPQGMLPELPSLHARNATRSRVLRRFPAARNRSSINEATTDVPA